MKPSGDMGKVPNGLAVDPAAGSDGRPGPSRGDRADLPLPARPYALVLLHWATVVCLLSAAAVILARTQFSDRHLKAGLLEVHRHFGLLVLLLLAWRLVLRLRLGRLVPLQASGRLARLVAALTHVLLYVVALALPVLGWLLSNAEGKPVHFLGLTLPQLVQPDFDLADTLLAWHQDAAWALLALASIHAVAALWHHFILRDPVLMAMLRLRRRRETAPGPTSPKHVNESRSS